MSVFAAAERHARSIIFIAVALAAAGIVLALGLPVGLFPQVSFPRVVVSLDAGDRPADQTQVLVTRPVEEAIRGVPGVLNVRSQSTRGSSQISVDFGWGRDMAVATLNVDAAVARVLPGLPAGARYDARRMDPTVFPIISYALLSETLSPVALRDLAQYRIVPLLSAISGLSRVGVQGGAAQEIEVETDPNKLAVYGLSFTDVTTALAAANVLQAVGKIEDHDKLYLVVSDHTLATLATIRDVVVRSDPTGVVRLRDIATIRDGVVPQWLRVVEDGRPAVLFNVYEQPDGNAVQIAADVKTALAGFSLPAGVTMKNWYDQSELVVQSATSVRDAVVIGLSLAGLVLWLFLRSLRLMSMALIAVAATLAITILLLSMLRLSFNIMTLGGIAAAVGLLIDDVIVMVEHIAHRAAPQPDAELGALTGKSAVMAAAAEFMTPLSGSSLATFIVFIPLSFLSGVTGAFSKALSITMGCALVVSYLMTAFVVPVLARSMVNFATLRPVTPGEHRGLYAKAHTAILDLFLRHRFVPIALLIPVVGLGAYAALHVATGFMPPVDEGGFVMDYYTKPGTSLTETEREIAQVEDIVKSMPEVDTFSRRLGTGIGGDLGQSYHGDFFVRLKPDHMRPTPNVMAAVTAEAAAKVPGVEIETAQLIEDLIGDLTAVPQPIEIKLTGAAPAVLNATAVNVASAIKGLDAVTGVKNGVNLAGDALNVTVDPVKVALEGASGDLVTQAVATAQTGAIATQYVNGEVRVGIRVIAPGAQHYTVTDLSQISIRAPDGHMFPLERVATITAISGQPQIGTENLQPMVAVTGRIEGRGLGAAISDVKTVLARPGLLPVGVTYTLGGLYQQQQIAFNGLAKVFVAALAAELVLLLFLYERFSLALIVIGCSLLSTAAVFTGLWLTGVDLNITALMGMTMVIGIGTEMAIFYVSEYAELANTLTPIQALREASRNRLRPITMTTIAALLTLAPLALSIGQGSAIQQPLAIAIISGLMLQFPLVLLVMPALMTFSLERTA
ncbi:MAG: efflux RND transporter permease subunit [Methylocella sp.]